MAGNKHETSHCPNCGALSVHRSRRKGITEHLLAVVGARLQRCHACNARFARLFNSAIYIEDARRALLRVGFLVLLLAGAAVVGLAMLWLMTRQAAPGPSDCLLLPSRYLPV
jgi:hypothetical protein